MGTLKIISETGMFHSACQVTTVQGANWYGFLPAVKSSPYADGKIDRQDRSDLINHFVTFSVTDTILDAAVTRVTADYAGKKYAVLVRDCVSFSADLGRYCGLTMPPVNMTPYGLIEILKVYNDYEDSA
ncbi:hypothetical protein [Yoonia sp. 2307UL14-13]|uniref:hypothetical protein n=1 Tax=Yoonia sp. 2307UL14-13 TaxID=3126506 RepID=UPI0030A4C623